MNKTKIFFDEEFTGLHKGTTIISIGLVDQYGNSFYAEFNDYDKSQINDDFLKNKVVGNLMFNDVNSIFEDTPKYNDLMKDHVVIWDCKMKGSSEEVKQKLTGWLSRYESVEMWSDCLAYDWVLFNNIFGGAFDIPKNVYYIPFDICTLFKIKGIDPDISREDFISNTVGGDKHNALYDAHVIKKCYEKLMTL